MMSPTAKASRFRSGAPLAVALLAVATVGCGVKGMPRPPEATAPRVPTGFRLKPVPEGTKLQWRRPTESMDGARLDDLAAFVIERSDGRGGFATIATVPVTDNDRLRPEQRFVYIDTDPVDAAVTRRYRVRALTADGQSSAYSEPSVSDNEDPDANEQP